jgi:hypothetical protein
MSDREEQEKVCTRLGVPIYPSLPHLKIGIALSTLNDRPPLNGLRHNPEGDTSGWYVWAGEYSSEDNFFDPLHIMHLSTICPEIIPYLGLPPGWRFLIAPDHEDVWVDSSLLASTR